MRLGLLACACAAFAVLRADPAWTLFRRWSAPASLLSAAFILALGGYLGWDLRSDLRGLRLAVRGFHGSLRVQDDGNPNDLDAVRRLFHGTILHGAQFTHPLRQLRPTMYYGPPSGVGKAIAACLKTGPVRVGVIGLGTGTLASYGRSGDYFRFYEISPAVIRIAATQFTFLAGSPARVDVIPGDARLSLAV